MVFTFFSVLHCHYKRTVIPRFRMMTEYNQIIASKIIMRFIDFI